MNLQFLRKLPFFADLGIKDLEMVCSMAEPITIRPGEFLMREGEPGDACYVVLDGEFEVTKRSGQQEVVIATRGAGEVLGEMSLLDHSPRFASVRALQETHVVMVTHDAFHQLLANSPTAATTMLHTVTSRLRNTEALLRQSEKMAALGTLSAGLAHELNNPAAAAQRSAAQLRDGLTEWQRWAAQLVELSLNHQQTQLVNDLRPEMIKRAASPVNLDPLTRSDQESELIDWLEILGLEQSWEVAPTVVSFGWNRADLEKLAQQFTNEEFMVVVRWLAAGCAVYALLNEVSMSTQRISEIVRAVKEYSYLDQAPIQEIDVHEGLKNTLVILQHKLRKKSVNVVTEFARDLPHIEAYGSELNQVWTNIIDNAIDAMPDQGELRLRTERRDNSVEVSICDNGPGIPPEVQSRVFEPFFTTKAPGVGTGLGLHITYNIVQKHHAQIRIDSQPGSTCFHVTLPLLLKRR